MTDDTPDSRAVSRRQVPDPACQAEIAALVPTAIARIRDILRTKNASRERLAVYRLQLDAAKNLLGLAGYVAPAPQKVISTDLSTLADLSAGDLRRLVERTESELGKRAKPVDGRRSESAPGESDPPAIDRAGAIDIEPGPPAIDRPGDATAEPAPAGDSATGSAPSAPRDGQNMADLLG